ncbi:ATP-binding protein [Leptospira montravelensis]|uniref:ATP-binding protein n=1 Tax=Leptospira montravelensis TaxID=2484961 RepID=A0ABY2LMG0_9LEPT|nr:ATP-binding protein [Leptospira montravelensis]TGK77685.1 ATP-binding protein [Leptospira montravelensis]TGK94986.1 ATP-binding protein [Leptospira montravelensis]
MNDNIFQQFLYLSEGDSLDFKRDQYKISKSTDYEKSEFIKDILSMANSWRKTEAYIILGILEKSNKPNELIGLNEHIDDATFQQLLNSKTNRTCHFSYQAYSFQGNTFGIFKIPIQERPIYLKKNFGNLKANVVYVRRGSSTAEASIEEISKMGLPLEEESKKPTLKLTFFDIQSEKSLGDQIYLQTKPFCILDNIPEYFGVNGLYPALGINKKFNRNLFEYFNFKYKYAKSNFLLENSGNIEAKNIKIEIQIADRDIEIVQNGDEPIEPDEYNSDYIRKLPHFSIPNEIEVKKGNKIITIHSTVESIHAKDKIQLEGNIYINPQYSRELILNCKIYCDKIEKPFEQRMEIHFHHTLQNILWEDFKNKFS